jgi:hypothetical protein
MILSKRKIMEFQEAALDTTRFGTGYGPVVRHTAWW